MALQGKKREKQESRKLFVGFTNARVLSISPSKEELAELLGTEVDEEKAEIEYVSEKDGVDRVRIDFWMEEISTNYIYKRSFFLENKDVETKLKEGQEEDSFVKRYQFINQTGDSFYCDSVDNIPDWFSKFQKNTSKTDKTKVVYGDKTVRVAKVGEADLMAFVKTWLSELDYWDADTSILLDTKKLFNSNFKELQEQVGGELESTVIDVLGVKIDTKDGEEKQYQDVYKTALPGYLWKVIKNLKITPEVIEKWRSEKLDKKAGTGTRYLKDYEQLICDLVDPSYPWSREFVLAPFQEFDESKSWVAGGETLVHSSESADY